MERRLLQITVAAIAFVPVYGGLYGLFAGLQGFGTSTAPAAESQFRYLSGLLIGIGFLFWGCVPGIENKGSLFRALTVIVLFGGLARLFGVFLTGDPRPLQWTLYLELGVTPALCLWQARLAAACGSPEHG